MTFHVAPEGAGLNGHALYEALVAGAVGVAAGLKSKLLKL